jgi:RNA polymerase sigma-70 factor, ECF subfamily
VQEAFAAALERWPRDGAPANPGAWLLTTARNRAIDRIRRERTLERKKELLAALQAEEMDDARGAARLDAQGELVLLDEQDRSLWDRTRIAEGRRVLSCLIPSPVVELNRAVAGPLAKGPERGLALIDRIDGLDGCRHLHSARADLLRRLERSDEAAVAYRRALELATQSAERAFLGRRLAQIEVTA